MRILPLAFASVLVIAAFASPPAAAEPVCGIDGDNDFVCHADAGSCHADVILYDVEDQPHVHQVSCDRSAEPSGPCISGIAGTQCTVAAGPCSATVGFYTPQSSQGLRGGCEAGPAECDASAGTSLITTTAIGAAADCTDGYKRCHAGYGIGQQLLPPKEPDLYCAV